LESSQKKAPGQKPGAMISVGPGRGPEVGEVT